MKTENFEKMLASLVCAGLILSGSVALAQNYSTSGSQMVYGVPQIIRLSQAKVSDDTIIAYVKNSGFSYSLNADQIINLRQQGVSDAVITTMLNQPRPAPVASTVSASPADTTPLYSPRQSDQIPTASAGTQPVPMAAVAPTVTYVQTAPAPVYYYYAQPYYQPCYYPSYAWFPPVSLSFAWGSGGHGGGWHH